MEPLDTEFWRGGLNPANEDVYEFVFSLLNELITLVPGQFFHLGGDEIQADCWQGDARIAEFLKTHNMTVTELYQLFLGRTMNETIRLGRRPVTWDSLWLSNATMPESAVVHVCVSRLGLDLLDSRIGCVPVSRRFRSDFAECPSCRYPHTHNNNTVEQVVKDGLDAVVSIFNGDYLAHQYVPRYPFC